MADLVTHLCTALLPKAITGGRHVGPFAVGTVLPDLASRVPAIGMGFLEGRGVDVPESFEYGVDVLHMPVGIAALCVLLGWCFVPEQRAPVTGWLLAGSALHLALDVLQHHFGQGYFLLFPFSLARWELGWIGSEATAAWAPWLALVTALAWAVRWWLRRREGPSEA